MKDLTFSNEDSTIKVTYRTDLIGSSARNFTVMQITGLDEFDLTNTAEEVALSVAFKQLPYNLTTFVQFATDNELQLTIEDSNGANKSTLVEIPEPEPEE